jgi:hypothetical protein
MDSKGTRAELLSAISELRRRQMDSSVNATYVGWTPEELATHGKRADRIAALFRQLGALDEAAAS